MKAEIFKHRSFHISPKKNIFISIIFEFVRFIWWQSCLESIRLFISSAHMYEVLRDGNDKTSSFVHRTRDNVKTSFWHGILGRHRTKNTFKLYFVYSGRRITKLCASINVCLIFGVKICAHSECVEMFSFPENSIHHHLQDSRFKFFEQFHLVNCLLH